MNKVPQTNDNDPLGFFGDPTYTPDQNMTEYTMMKDRELANMLTDPEVERTRKFLEARAKARQDAREGRKNRSKAVDTRTWWMKVLDRLFSQRRTFRAGLE